MSENATGVESNDNTNDTKGRGFVKPSLNYPPVRYIMLFLLAVITALLPYNEVWGRKVVVLLFLLWIASIRSTNWSSVKFHPVLLWATIFLCYQLLSLSWSENISAGSGYVYRYFTYFFVPLMVSATLLDDRTSKMVIILFVVSMLLNTAYTLQYIPDILSGKLGRGNLSMFMNPIYFSIMTAFVFLMGLVYLVKRSWGIKEFFIVCTMTLLMGVLIILGQRTGIFIVLITAPLLIYVASDGWGAYLRGTMLSVVILALVALMTAGYMLHKSFKNRIDRIGKDIAMVVDGDNNRFKSSIGVRLSSYALLPDIFSEVSILTGAGVGDGHDTYARVIDEKYSDTMRKYSSMHSYYLDSIVGLGIIGLWMFWKIMLELYRCNLPNKRYHHMNIAFIMVIVLSNIPARGFHQQNTMMLFGIFMGLFVALSIGKDSEPSTV